MRKALLFCLNLKKVLLKIIACFRESMMNMLYLRPRTKIGLDGSKVAISALKTKNVQDSRKNFKMKIWRFYSMKIGCQTLKLSSDTLNVTEMAVRKRLHNLGLVRKVKN